MKIFEYNNLLTAFHNIRLLAGDLATLYNPDPAIAESSIYYKPNEDQPTKNGTALVCHATRISGQIYDAMLTLEKDIRDDCKKDNEIIGKLYAGLLEVLADTDFPKAKSMGLFGKLREECELWKQLFDDAKIIREQSKNFENYIKMLPSVVQGQARAFFYAGADAEPDNGSGEHEEYVKMCRCGNISGLFEWCGTIADLAFWLEGILPETRSGGTQWIKVDGLFTKNGEPITAKQLKNSNRARR